MDEGQNGVVNYILRGLAIPSGTYEIEFRYEPKVIEQGSAIQISPIVLFFFTCFEY